HGESDDGVVQRSAVGRALPAGGACGAHHPCRPAGWSRAEAIRRDGYRADGRGLCGLVRAPALVGRVLEIPMTVVAPDAVAEPVRGSILPVHLIQVETIDGLYTPIGLRMPSGD